MMNQKNQSQINDQVDKSQLVDDIQNALYKSTMGSQWLKAFEGQWGCEVSVLCQPSPKEVGAPIVHLIVRPVTEEDGSEAYLPQFLFRARLFEVKTPTGVWPAIARRAGRLSAIGQLLKSIRHVLGLVHTEEQEEALYGLFGGGSCNLCDSTGFELFMSMPFESDSSRATRSPEGVPLGEDLETTLQKWLDDVTPLAHRSITRFQGNLAAVNFKADHTWSLVVGSDVLAGFWGYETEHEPPRVKIYGRHDFHVPPLRPTKFEDWPKWERAPFELALADQDFNGEPGWLKICAGLDVPPRTLVASSVELQAEAIDANLDYNA
ncbi:MAG: hypothetical protein A3E23_07840 [Burkholderiales bacterium RIFCSPHIGHO2_12_FULL_65_48]|nr:MAG: hypothetical protein A3C40_02655 [Burkholderiales bacterium RIFCSPHIGHO2_02_FULL_64_19]OGB25070.1 MAG: hypothetical protein A3E23_07840 [Burkholderiales bacterium RIFCSPHIGHO2_12_FULL_65_48]OGB53724.1 MAG: hypothetical protein A3F71_09880 [Burkholderiales bacterium RIFCSPLOWO2_12_FULL_64_33]